MALQKDTIAMVVNFDLPAHVALFENRAGLLGKSGTVVSYVTPTKATREIAPDLVDFLTRESQVRVHGACKDLRSLGCMSAWCLLGTTSSLCPLDYLTHSFADKRLLPPPPPLVTAN